DPEFDYTTLKLVHYNSFEKPWHHDHVLYADKFWEAAEGSPFFEDLKKIRENVGEAHLQKEEKGVKALVEKATYLATTEDVTFKKVLAL
nr:hypothetical protein [Bacilli bacterium]